MKKMTFQDLLRRASKVQMSVDQKDRQRRSFAFGNASIENNHVTREIVAHVVTAEKRKKAHR